MNFHKIAHRLFLLFMFAVCSVAVVMFVRERADASINSNVSPIISNGFASVNYVADVQPNAPTSPNDIANLKEVIATPNPINNTAVTAKTVNKTVQSAAVKKTNVKVETTKKVPTNTASVANIKNTKTLQISVEPINKPATISDVINNSDKSQPVPAPQEKINTPIAEPVIVKAADLPREKNPKVAGAVDKALSVKTVDLIRKPDGQKNLVIAGNAKPNVTILIYIFSSDPIVITLKADENGNWSYEMNKDLADGQHEAFVAISDAGGNIVSKSEPLAFVKTAQAATTIPLSQLSENQSPIERSVSQYVLIAIIIMVVFLMIALVSIGVLTHKRNINEPII